MTMNVVNFRQVYKFECIRCLEFVDPPFLTCFNNHMFCSDCFVHQCPACGGHKNKYGHMQLCEMYDNMLLPCVNYRRGCRYTGRSKDIYHHKKQCQLNMDYCPFSMSDRMQCKWNGPHFKLQPHLEKSHDMMYDHSDFAILEGFSEKPFWREPLQVDGQIFLACFSKEESGFLVGVYAIRPTQRITHQYKIVISDDNKTKSVIVNGEVEWFKSPNKFILDTFNCVDLCNRTIDGFRGPRGLRYYVRVEKKYDMRKYC
ncbi:uncharacterized protein LOC109601960 [Aethina tumida]|uniref:uncharacterized protein LOC109601960 n=1 Tax=Aethina tumida TaxID=116153 RepID=UPI00096B66D2|nr:uncharacterized protein LOC109601960 [Aethina tumida]